MEVYNGHLYVHLNLGAGPSKQRASKRRIDDGDWHEVVFRRSAREARIIVDGKHHTDFKTAGNSLIPYENRGSLRAFRMTTRSIFGTSIKKQLQRVLGSVHNMLQNIASTSNVSCLYFKRSKSVDGALSKRELD